MEMEPVPGYTFANWEQGYGDFHLVPDLDTLRVASWLEKTALVLCDVEDDGSGQSISARAALDAAASGGRGARGWVSPAAAASELEYYLFQHRLPRRPRPRAISGLEPAGWYLEDYHILQGTRTESFTAAVRHHLKHSGVPVENSKGEWGLGQHELNVRYADALEMADRHVVYKQCLKEIADRMDVSVDVHGQVRRRSRGIELSRAPQPVGG